MSLYFKIKLIEEYLIPLLVIVIVIFIIIFKYLNSILNKKFKKNCFKCKYYKLSDVASFGDRCWYTCIKNDAEEVHSFNDREKYVKCEKFKKKEAKQWDV